MLKLINKIEIVLTSTCSSYSVKGNKLIELAYKTELPELRDLLLELGKLYTNVIVHKFKGNAWVQDRNTVQTKICDCSDRLHVLITQLKALQTPEWQILAMRNNWVPKQY